MNGEPVRFIRYNAAILLDAGSADERTLDSLELLAIGDEEAVKHATQWVGGVMIWENVLLATLQVVRASDGYGVRTIPVQVVH